MNEDDNICEEQLSDSFCVEETDNVERQSHFQANCGANLSWHEPGVLEFELQPYIYQISRRHGVYASNILTRAYNKEEVYSCREHNTCHLRLSASSFRASLAIA